MRVGSDANDAGDGPILADFWRLIKPEALKNVGVKIGRTRFREMLEKVKKEL